MKKINKLMSDSIEKLEKLTNKDHVMNCNVCGQEMDLRDLSQVFAHEPCNGFVDYDKVEKIQHSGAIKIGEPILYTKNNGEINLN